MGQNKEESKPAEREEQQDESKRKRTDRKAPTTKPPKTPNTSEVPVTMLRNESTTNQESRAEQQPQNVLDQFIRDSKWIDFGMLILAAVAAWFAYRAYGASHQQAQAAQATLTLTINSERPWIGVKTPINPPKLDMTGMWDEKWRNFRFHSRNCGKTVARIIEIRTRYHIVSRQEKIPDTPEYLSPSEIAGQVLIVPNGGFEFTAFLENEITDDPFKNLILPLWEEKMDCFAYALIRYIDPVSTEERITQICYQWRTIGGFKIGGPPEYNRAT